MANDSVTSIKHIHDFSKDALGTKEVDLVIDCSANILDSKGWQVVENKKGGIIPLEGLTLGLYLDEGQQNGRSINGNDLRKALKDQKVLNVSALDFFLENPGLIPDEWQSKDICFWGTIYRYKNRLYVRCLRFRDGRWYDYHRWLDLVWSDGDPAIVRVNA